MNCKFQKKGKLDDRFKLWMNSVPGQEYEAHCKICKTTISVCSMGESAIVSHTKAKEHTANVQNCSLSNRDFFYEQQV